jgi:hypothetical protein
VLIAVGVVLFVVIAVALAWEAFKAYVSETQMRSL